MNTPTQNIGNLVTRISNRFRDALSNNIASFGLVNVYSKAADPDLERKIVTSSASYGRQLGILMDALNNVIEQSTHLDNQSEALRRFQALRNEINTVKAEHRRSAADQADHLVKALQTLSQDAPAQFNRIKPLMLQMLIDTPVLEPAT